MTDRVSVNLPDEALTVMMELGRYIEYVRIHQNAGDLRDRHARELDMLAQQKRLFVSYETWSRSLGQKTQGGENG